MDNDRPLLQGLTEDEILVAAERWMALMNADHLTWISHAGYEGDFYPVQHPDERFLSLSMWTRFTTTNPSPLLQCSKKTHGETEEYLRQFADKLREMHARKAAEEQVVLPPLPIGGEVEETA